MNATQGHDAGTGPIVVPVDFSEHSWDAVRYAVGLAAQAGRQLLVLHVVHDPGSAPGYYQKARIEGGIARLEELADEMFDEFMVDAAERCPGLTGLDFDRLQVVGLPATRILEVIEARGASHVVMGSRGRTGLQHLLLGSKALRIAQLSPVPVTIVKAGQVPYRGSLEETS